MQGTVRVGNFCIDENDKATIKYLKFLYDVQDQLENGKTFKDFGSHDSNIITAEQLKV